MTESFPRGDRWHLVGWLETDPPPCGLDREEGPVWIRSSFGRMFGPDYLTGESDDRPDR